MRKAMYPPVLLGFVGILFADDPFTGTWKLNHEQSKYAKGSPPKEETLVIEQQGDQYQITITGTDPIGSPISIKYTVAMNGGTALVREGPYDAVDTTRRNINTRETSYIKDNKMVRSARAVTSNDGKTMKVTVKGTDAHGKPVVGVSVFEKQ